ncbi:MAG TPA: thiamine biosynthesis protein ThiS [Bacteroidales bacterium]|nr:thiamine biosynthesis protein ThiS [Bacteroidales bacterium]
MKIVLNNREETIEGETISFEELMRYKNFTFKLLVTKLNGKTIPKQERETTYISNNDEVLIIHMISGG